MNASNSSGGWTPEAYGVHLDIPADQRAPVRETLTRFNVSEWVNTADSDVRDITVTLAKDAKGKHAECKSVTIYLANMRGQDIRLRAVRVCGWDATLPATKGAQESSTSSIALPAAYAVPSLPPSLSPSPAKSTMSSLLCDFLHGSYSIVSHHSCS